MKSIEIVLQPAAVLKGRLIDAKTNEPLGNAKIKCLGPIPLETVSHHNPFFNVNLGEPTDDQGNFRIKGDGRKTL